MKALQTISGLSAQSGGPSSCTFELLEGLSRLGAHVDLLTASSPDMLGKGRPWMHDVPCDYKTPLGFSRNIARFLRNTDYDVYHANALWSYTSHVTCQTARARQKPYVLSPHGMLYPTALAISRWKKVPMLKLWFNKDIHSAACLHATCEQERQYCRDFGYKGPIAIIPNAVTLPDDVDSLFEQKKRYMLGEKQVGERVVFGFLGRLHPIKQVENILYALVQLPKDVLKRVSVVIIGKDNAQYEDFLRNEVVRLHLTNNVDFMGFVQGREKFEHLARMTAMFVPSRQENFGMIIPEALSVGTPVIASYGTPWQEMNDCQCGWWTDCSPNNLAALMLQLVQFTSERLLDMGRRGQQLIKEHYASSTIANKMNAVYAWLANEAERPDWVDTE